MSSHRGAGAFSGNSLNGGQRWQATSRPREASLRVINGKIQGALVPSHAQAIDIGAARRPDSYPEHIKDVVPASSLVQRPQQSSVSVSVSEKCETLISRSSTSYQADSNSKNSKNLPHGHATTEVIVHYAVPTGQRFLPITLNDLVTMVRIGSHGVFEVYEPINNWLKSPEADAR